MKKVPLSNGGEFLVDDEDFAFLMQWKWKKSPQGYASRTVYKGNNKFGTLNVHVLLAKPPKGKIVDHDNENKLDDRKENLKVVSKSYNNRHKGIPKNNTSGFLNVSKGKNGGWRAYFKLNDKFFSLGTYVTPEEASAVAETKKKELLNLEVPDAS